MAGVAGAESIAVITIVAVRCIAIPIVVTVATYYDYRGPVVVVVVVVGGGRVIAVTIVAIAAG